MRRLLKLFFGILITVILVCTPIVGGAYGYVHFNMEKSGYSYTQTVEDILVGLVPETGITVNGRNYDSYSVRNFLEEIRYDPYNYVHKDHHCVLQYVPEKQIFWVVSLLRIIMGCQ